MSLYLRNNKTGLFYDPEVANYTSSDPIDLTALKHDPAIVNQIGFVYSHPQRDYDFLRIWDDQSLDTAIENSAMGHFKALHPHLIHQWDKRALVALSSYANAFPLFEYAVRVELLTEEQKQLIRDHFPNFSASKRLSSYVGLADEAHMMLLKLSGAEIIGLEAIREKYKDHIDKDTVKIYSSWGQDC